jgi:hypothetical protein
MRSERIFLTLLILVSVGLGWMTGCTKQILPVIPRNLPVNVGPTATVTSGCVTEGTHDPSPVATIQISNNHYEARLYSAGSICGSGFNEFQVYVNNLDSSPATMEAAVYDNTQLVADGSLVVAAHDIGWKTVSLTAFSISCADPVVLAVRVQGAVFTIGAAPGSASCGTDGAAQAGPMPSTYPNPSFLSSPGSSGWCYEMSLDSCGL